MKKTITPDKLAEHFDWCGDDIIGLMIDTLTECNYHTEVKHIRKALNNMPDVMGSFDKNGDTI